MPTDVFEEQASNGTSGGSVTGHEDTFASINPTRGGDRAVWARKTTASGRIDLDRSEHGPPVGREFEAFTSKWVFYGI